MERSKKVRVAEMLGVGLLQMAKEGRWKKRIFLLFTPGPQGSVLFLPSILNFSNPLLPAPIQVWEGWPAKYRNATPWCKLLTRRDTLGRRCVCPEFGQNSSLRPQEHTDIVNGDTDSFATPENWSLLQVYSKIWRHWPPWYHRCPPSFSLPVSVPLPGWMSSVEQFHRPVRG